MSAFGGKARHRMDTQEVRSRPKADFLALHPLTRESCNFRARR